MVQALKREFETISMKRNEKVDDYSNRFARVVTSLRNLGKNLDKYGAFSRLLRSVAKEFDDLILLHEKISDLKSMRLEETFGQLKVHELKLQERNLRDEEQGLLSRAISSPIRTKGVHLQIEEDMEGKEKAKIMVVKWMEKIRRSHLANPR